MMSFDTFPVGVNKLLQAGGLCLPEATRQAIVRDLSSEAREGLRRIALGEIAVHPKVRSKAITLLGFDDVEPDISLDALKAVLSADDPTLKVRALRSIGRLRPTAVVTEARQIIQDPTTRPDLALAAARLLTLAEDPASIDDLRALKNRILPMAPSADSPSIVYMNQLISQVEDL